MAPSLIDDRDWGHGGYCYYDFNDWKSYFDCWTTVDIKQKINNDMDTGYDGDIEDNVLKDNNLPNNSDESSNCLKKLYSLFFN